MIRIYKADDFDFKDYDRGKRVIVFSKDLSARPAEFTDRTFVELLTENGRTMYSLRQIHFDEEAGIFYPERFAVNYGAIYVDSMPLVRGFIPEGPWAQMQTLYEVMPKKKEIHVIPDPARRLFYEESKVNTDNTFYFEGTLDDVLEGFRSAGFSMREFAPGFDFIGNTDNPKRYFKEEGFDYIKEGLPLK
jgi:hypothetical protein